MSHRTFSMIHSALDHIIQGDVRDVLPTLPDESVDCVVTSPPYWGLRDYGVKGQLGLEDTVDAYIETMTAVMREVLRVLKLDGTAWINMGDTYAGSWGSYGGGDDTGGKQAKSWAGQGVKNARPPQSYMMRKNLVGVPWRLAFAMQADGWILRSDIIWAKPNPMPESVKDRPGKAHEYVFLFVRHPKYHYDAEAVREPVTGGAHDSRGDKGSAPKARRYPSGWNTEHEGSDKKGRYPKGKGRAEFQNAISGKLDTDTRHGRSIWYTDESGGYREDGRRDDGRLDGKRHAGFKDWDARSRHDQLVGHGMRDVWNIHPQGCPAAHFATFPIALVRRCILAGCPPGGVVLDPFMGSGSTAIAAVDTGRHYLGIELHPEYVEIAKKRIMNEGQPPLFTEEPCQS